jgi:hypothetical protein
MKKLVEKMVNCCDKCGKEQVFLLKCQECKIELCNSCCKSSMIVYPHSVYRNGSDDGHYCKECDTNLTERSLVKKRLDTLHNAYVDLQRLINENIHIQNKYKQAEEEIQKQLRKRRHCK